MNTTFVNNVFNGLITLSPDSFKNCKKKKKIFLSDYEFATLE